MPDSRRTDWPTLLLLFAMYGLLLGNALLYVRAPLPLVVHILIATLAIHLSFTIWHEAAHGNVFRRRGLNDLVGALGILPYTPPFFLQKYIHLRHHAYMNQPQDPNAIYIDGSLWTLPLRYPRAMRYAKQTMQQDPRGRGERIWDTSASALALGLCGLAWWYGVLLDLIWLWLLPLGLAKLVMDAYVNYLPHVGLPADRFLGTRVVDVAWLTPLVLGHNYHAIHHLWPRIPWHGYRSTFRERLGYLQDHGVPIQHSIRPEFLPGVGIEPSGDLPR
jgi:beta-carotene hydroxylase